MHDVCLSATLEINASKTILREACRELRSLYIIKATKKDIDQTGMIKVMYRYTKQQE